jgi:cellulose synthase/poly-beta-1,6-N-acetylglucosamine synthase-like glycosyltransferase
MGYRCIAVPDVVVYEFVPNTLRANISRKVRRARHLIHLFVQMERATKDVNMKASKNARHIFFMEKVLHLLTPWALISAALTLLIDSLVDPSLATVVLACSILIALCSNRFRMWVLSQAILAYGLIINMFGNELLVWEPVRDIRLKKQHA